MQQPGALTAPLSFGINARVGSYGSGVYATGTLPGAYAVRSGPSRNLLPRCLTQAARVRYFVGESSSSSTSNVKLIA